MQKKKYEYITHVEHLWGRLKPRFVISRSDATPDHTLAFSRYIFSIVLFELNASYCDESRAISLITLCNKTWTKIESRKVYALGCWLSVRE